MLPLLIPDPNPMADLRRLGINASLAWAGDANQDHDALVFVSAEADNLQRLERWIKGQDQR